MRDQSGDMGTVVAPFNRTSATGHWTLSSTDSNLNGLNQSPFKSPSVFNFFEPDYVPTSTNFGTSTKVAPEMYLITETSIAAYQNFFLYFMERGMVLLGQWQHYGVGGKLGVSAVGQSADSTGESAEFGTRGWKVKSQ